MFGKIFAYLLAIFFIGYGIFSSKSYNEKSRRTSVQGVTAGTGSFIGDIITYIAAFVLGLVPWYIFKILAILFGATLIILISIS